MKITTYLMTIFLGIYNCNISYSQFLSAVVTETALGSGATATANTGNDVFYDGANSILFTVWESAGNLAGIAFDDFAGNSSAYTLQNGDAIDPDVSVINDGTNTFAIVAYYSPGQSSYMAEIYTFTGVALNLYIGSPVTLMSSVSFGTAINIDGNLLGDFAIVFDIDSSGINIPKCITGSMPSGAPTLNFTTPTSLILSYPGPTGNYSIQYPDVCLYDTTINGTVVMYVSYYNQTTSKIAVQVERWSDISTATPQIYQTIFANITPTITVLDPPRIACSAKTGSAYHLTVVYSNGNFVEAWNNKPGASPSYLIYTDNSLFTIAIDAAPNRFPVVTYDGSGNDEIYIGWTYDNSGNVYGSGYHPGDILPVGIRCNDDGTPISTVYWDVPRNINGDAQILSIAGRNSPNDIGLSWFDAGSTDIYHKVIGIPTTSFRSTSAIVPYTQNSFESDYFIILDFLGRNVFETSAHSMPKYDFLNELGLKSGIYLVKYVSKSGVKTTKYYIH